VKKISLQEHIEQSKIAVAANKAKGNRHGMILTQLYADRYRFLEEILQNTEDAYAAVEQQGKILFSLQENDLYVAHNGKTFDEEDLKSITTYAASTKQKNEFNEIGKFGIGFKSVFAICKRPEIHSGNYHFAIRDYEVLEKIAPTDKFTEYSTVFRFPLEKNQSEVEDGLEKINYQHLLFLKYLCQIEIQTASKSWTLEKTLTALSPDIHELIVEDANQERKFLLFSKKENNPFHIAFAFAFQKDGEDKLHFQAVEKSLLYVYFPTQEYTALDFLIHAHFSTTPTREKISFDEQQSPANKKMEVELETHYGRALKEMAKFNLLNLSLISLLPLSTETKSLDAVYMLFHHFSIKAFKDFSLIPTNTKTYASANKVLIKADSLFSTLFTKKEIKRIFGRSLFVNEDITALPELQKSFMQDLEIKELSPEKWAFHIMLHPYLLEKKSDEWFKRFYHVLLEYPFLWNKENANRYYSLRDKAFILTQYRKLSPMLNAKGDYIVFRDYGRAQANNIIRRKLLSDEQLNAFFLRLEIPEYEKNTEQKQLQLQPEDWSKSFAMNALHLSLADTTSTLSEKDILLVKASLQTKYPAMQRAFPTKLYQLEEKTHPLYVFIIAAKTNEIAIPSTYWEFALEEYKKPQQSTILWVFVNEKAELKIVENPIAALLAGKIIPHSFKLS
jgi:hypothetical protein